MPDLVVTDIPDTVFSVLKSLASEKGLSVEEFVKQLICDTVATQSLAGGKSISIQQLQGNIDAYFRLAEHEAIFIVDEDDERFVLISIDEVNHLTKMTAGNDEYPTTG